MDSVSINMYIVSADKMVIISLYLSDTFYPNRCQSTPHVVSASAWMYIASSTL